MEQWLECTISQGQFSGEFAVRGELFNGTGFSLFAEREDLRFEGEPIEGRPVKGSIRVTPGPCQDGLILVTLPQPALENGWSVTVKADSVK